MATITSGNWSLRDPGDDVPDGSIIEGGNFSQLVPDTEILVGKTLTICGGNWVNVKSQPAWTIEGGNWAQISRCSHLHPTWVVKGLSECIESCPHVTDVDKIEVGGVVVETIYSYKDTV